MAIHTTPFHATASGCAVIEDKVQTVPLLLYSIPADVAATMKFGVTLDGVPAGPVTPCIP